MSCVVCFLSQPLNAGKPGFRFHLCCRLPARSLDSSVGSSDIILVIIAWAGTCQAQGSQSGGQSEHKQLNTQLLPSWVQCLMGVFLRRLETTIFISSSVVYGCHILLYVVTTVFELCVANSAVSAVWQICNVQWLLTRMGCGWHWLCHSIITAAQCIGSHCTPIRFCD